MPPEPFYPMPHDRRRDLRHRLDHWVLTDEERAEYERELLLNVVRCADQLADTYGRCWAKDGKFYAYQDARSALEPLAPSMPSVRNGECGWLKPAFGADGQMICRLPAGHDGGHVWERP